MQYLTALTDITSETVLENIGLPLKAASNVETLSLSADPDTRPHLVRVLFGYSYV